MVLSGHETKGFGWFISEGGSKGEKLAFVLALLLMLVFFGCEGIGAESESETKNSSLTTGTTADNEAIAAEELFELYLTLFNQIYADDIGLNYDISVIAVDFSKIENLTENEKALLVSQLPKNGLEIRAATYEALKNEGLIDENGIFTGGVLISIDSKTTGENKVTFSLSKYRTPIGGTGYSHSTAVFQNREWTISYKGEWIS